MASVVQAVAVPLAGLFLSMRLHLGVEWSLYLVSVLFVPQLLICTLLISNLVALLFSSEFRVLPEVTL